MLGIAGDTVGADPRLPVAPQVAIGVLAQPEVGRFGDEDAALDERERSRHDQAIEEYRRTVGAAVGIRIFEYDDAADRIALATTLQIAHVALVFDHPDAAVGVEVKEDRAVHQWLGGHELDAIAGSEAERLQGRDGIERRRWRHGDACEEGVGLLPIGPAGELRWRPRARSLLRRRSGLGTLPGGGEGQGGCENREHGQVMATHRAGLRRRMLLHGRLHPRPVKPSW